MDNLSNIRRWLVETSKTSGRSIPSILFDFIRLKRKERIAKEEYSNFRLYSDNRYFRETFLPFTQAQIYWKLLNPDAYAPLARDKYIAHCLFSQVGIPTSELYLYYNPQLATTNSSQAYNIEGVIEILKQKSVKQCVIKLAQDSAHGDGVIVCHDIKIDGNQCLLKRYDNSYIDLKDVLKDQPLLFESLIVQNKQFASFNNSSVNTIRMMTALYPDNTVKLFAAFLKIGRDGSDVDNAGGGGNVDCAVDITTGELHNVVEFNSWNDVRKITHHPDSNTLLEGVRIEGWNEIVKMVNDYQARLPQLKTIGWDIAVTENGPTVIEINNWWDATGQLFIGKGWKNEVIECYNAWSNIK